MREAVAAGAACEVEEGRGPVTSRAEAEDEPGHNQESGSRQYGPSLEARLLPLRVPDGVGQVQRLQPLERLAGETHRVVCCLDGPQRSSNLADCRKIEADSP